MKFLILGANFQNKGAQAMLFITTSELKTRFPGCEVLFLTREKPQKGYEFTYIYDLTGWDTLKGGYYAVKAIPRILLLKLNGQKNVISRSKKFIAAVKSVDAFIDISGYALSSQRGVSRSVSFLNQIRVARRLKIPYFIMPQSIGPFKYGKDQAKMDRLLRKYLSYPVKIFPREEEGFNILTKDYGLKNAEQSYDLVLQNRSIDLDKVINSDYQKTIPQLETSGNVAIIPNVRNYSYGSKEKFKELYIKIIRRLQYHGKTVYLIRHSEEDLEACHLIFDDLKDREGVYIFEDDFNCLQFNGIVSQMDYIIGSRYHGIVHSLKNAVPALVLGWATKYQVLLKMFCQERFLFDVRGDIDETALIDAIDDMERSWKDEKETIKSKLPDYQQENCFDSISEYFKK